MSVRIYLKDRNPVAVKDGDSVSRVFQNEAVQEKLGANDVTIVVKSAEGKTVAAFLPSQVIGWSTNKAIGGSVFDEKRG